MRNKKILAIFLAIAIFVTCMPAYASAPEQEPKVITVLTEGQLDDAEGADIVQIAYEDLHIIANKAKNLIDNGALLFISAPQDSLENVAAMLSIPKDSVSIYDDSLELLAYSIYYNGNIYIFQIHYALYADAIPQSETIANDHMSGNINLENLQNTFNDAKVICSDSEHKAQIEGSLKIAYVSMQDSLEFEKTVTAQSGSSRSASFPEKSSRATTATLSVFSSDKTELGHLEGTQFMYDKGYCTVNRQTQFLFNVVSFVAAYPSNTTVTKYKVRMHCNIEGHTLVVPATIPTSVNYTQNVTVGYQFSSTGAGTSGSTTTGWSYNPQSQIINRTSPQSRVMDWNIETTKIEGQSYDVTTGIQVATTNGVGSRGTFTTMYCDSIRMSDGGIDKTNSLEFGEWF